MFENFFRSRDADALEVLGKIDTVRRLHGLIDEAQKHVTLISPYVSIEKLRDIERKIRQALDREVAVTLVIREGDESTRGPSQQGVELLVSLMQAGMRLFVVRDLHAKLYYSERHALITSLNLIESSFNNSIEVGICVSAGRAEYVKISDFIESEITPHRKEVPFKPATEPRRRSATPVPRYATQGFCIRCRDAIGFNPERPYCDSDFNVWRRYSDPTYEDNHCHHCGMDFAASKNKPLCRKCYGMLR